MNETRVAPSDARDTSENGEEQEFVSHDIPRAIRISEALRKFVDMVDRAGSWLFIPVVLITVPTHFPEVHRRAGLLCEHRT